MEFSPNRRKAAALVTLVFVLGIAFGVVGVLAGRRLMDAENRSGVGDGNGNGQGQQIGRLARELNLTADQEGRFRQVLSETRNRYDAIRKAMEPQFTEVREQNRDKIRQILTAEQRPLFEEFMRSPRNRRNQQNNNDRDNGNNNQNGNRNGRGDQNGDQNGDRNDSTPSVRRLTQELNLTAEQQGKLSDILRETRTSLDALRQQMNPQFEQVRLEDRERLRQMVTPQQRPAFDAYFQQRDDERRRR